MIRIYLTSLEINENLINGKIFNAGYDNHKVIDLAEIVRQNIGSDTEVIVSCK